jgi:Fe-S oxidoreductase
VHDPRAAREPAVLAARQDPRDLALIEAFLYEEQTRRGVSIKHWEEFEDVADHCTVCHKCVTPCPVNIDFGDVSMNMRNLLRKMDKKQLQAGQPRAAMFFLNATDPTTINATRKAMVDWGYKAQRLGKRAEGGRQEADQGAAADHRQAPVREQVIHFINKKMPGNLPKKTARALLDIEDDKVIPIIRNPKTTNADTEAVFYFPGCGSERLFSQVGLATQAMLWEVGVQTVLPPGYLCCGYPQRGAGQYDKADKMMTDNRVLFHRMANTLNYLDIKTVLVSCGTCYDQLATYEFEKIFPGCRIMDIHEYLLEKGVKLEGVTGTRYMYHDPCHTPMKLQDSMKTVNALMRRSTTSRSRRTTAAAASRAPCRVASGHLDPGPLPQGRGNGEGRRQAARRRLHGEVKILTSCPSCLQGLSRYNDDSGTTADYIVVEIAQAPAGRELAAANDYVCACASCWPRLARLNNGGIEYPGAGMRPQHGFVHLGLPVQAR